MLSSRCHPHVASTRRRARSIMPIRIARLAVGCAMLLGAPGPLGAQEFPQPPAPDAAGPPAAMTPTTFPPPAKAAGIVFEPIYEFALKAQPAAPPAVDATAAYVPLRTGEIVAVDLLRGGIRWRVDVATALAPMAREGVVIVAGDDELLALEALDGTVRWRVPVPGGISGPPLIDTGWVVAGTESGDVLAIHASDGRVLWTAAVGAPVRVRPFAAASGLYLSVSDGRVVSLALEDGAIRWERQLKGTPGALLVLDEQLYVGADDKFFYCLDTEDGEIEWDHGPRGRPAGPAAVDTERVYYVGLDNILYAFDRDGGSIKWNHMLSFRPSSGPAVLGQVVVVAGVSAEIQAFAVESGRPVAQARVAADLAAAPESVPGLLPPAWRPLLLLTREGTVRLLQQRVEPAPIPLPYPIGAEVPLEALIPRSP